MDIYLSNRTTRAQIFHFFHISDWMGVVIVEWRGPCAVASMAPQFGLSDPLGSCWLLFAKLGYSGCITSWAWGDSLSMMAVKLKYRFETILALLLPREHIRDGLYNASSATLRFRRRLHCVLSTSLTLSGKSASSSDSLRSFRSHGSRIQPQG